MRIQYIIHKIVENTNDLKDCYGALKMSDIEDVELANAIYMLESIVGDLKRHPKTIEEIYGKQERED